MQHILSAMWKDFKGFTTLIGNNTQKMKNAYATYVHAVPFNILGLVPKVLDPSHDKAVICPHLLTFGVQHDGIKRRVYKYYVLC
jgi:hypothetical protein